MKVVQIRHCARRRFALTLAAMLLAACAVAQPTAGDGSSTSQGVPLVRFTASLSASSDFYAVSGIEARQPWNVSRLVFHPTVILVDQIELPFEAYVTTTGSGYRQPFNQFGVSPRLWGILTLHAGYFSTRFSDFTFGDQRVLGGGFEITPGKWRIGALYGVSTQPRAPDASAQFYGAYRRWVWAGQVGYGSDDGASATLNVVHTLDDATSLSDASIAAALDTTILPDTLRSNPDSVAARVNQVRPAPTENMAVSLSFGVPVTSAVQLYAETGVSAFSNDTRIDARNNQEFLPTSIFTVRNSTQIDAAVKGGLLVHPASWWNVRVNAQWIGPGYTSLGYSQIANDIVEFSVAPDFRLFQSALILRGSLGIRSNNLRNNRLATTRRVVASFGSSITFDPNVGLDLQYNNYGMHADNNGVTNVFQYLSVAPHVNFEGFGGVNTASVTYSFQDVSTSTVTHVIVPGVVDSTTPPAAYDSSSSIYSKTHTLLALHTVVLPSTMSFTTSVLATYIDAGALTRIVNVTETVGEQFAENTVTASLTLGYGVVTTTASDGQIIGRAMLTWQLGTMGSLSFSLSHNNYRYGVANPATANYSETIASLQYGLTF